MCVFRLCGKLNILKRIYDFNVYNNNRDWVWRHPWTPIPFTAICVGPMTFGMEAETLSASKFWKVEPLSQNDEIVHDATNVLKQHNLFNFEYLRDMSLKDHAKKNLMRSYWFYVFKNIDKHALVDEEQGQGPKWWDTFPCKQYGFRPHYNHHFIVTNLEMISHDIAEMKRNDFAAPSFETCKVDGFDNKFWKIDQKIKMEREKKSKKEAGRTKKGTRGSYQWNEDDEEKKIESQLNKEERRKRKSRSKKNKDSEGEDAESSEREDSRKKRKSNKKKKKKGRRKKKSDKEEADDSEPQTKRRKPKGRKAKKKRIELDLTHSDSEDAFKKTKRKKKKKKNMDKKTRKGKDKHFKDTDDERKENESKDLRSFDERAVSLHKKHDPSFLEEIDPSQVEDMDLSFLSPKSKFVKFKHLQLDQNNKQDGQDDLKDPTEWFHVAGYGKVKQEYKHLFKCKPGPLDFAILIETKPSRQAHNRSVSKWCLLPMMSATSKSPKLSEFCHYHWAGYLMNVQGHKLCTLRNHGAKMMKDKRANKNLIALWDYMLDDNKAYGDIPRLGGIMKVDTKKTFIMQQDYWSKPIPVCVPRYIEMLLFVALRKSRFMGRSVLSDTAYSSSHFFLETILLGRPLWTKNLNDIYRLYLDHASDEAPFDLTGFMGAHIEDYSSIGKWNNPLVVGEQAKISRFDCHWDRPELGMIISDRRY